MNLCATFEPKEGNHAEGQTGTEGPGKAGGRTAFPGLPAGSGPGGGRRPRHRRARRGRRRRVGKDPHPLRMGGQAPRRRRGAERHPGGGLQRFRGSGTQGPHRGALRAHGRRRLGRDPPRPELAALARGPPGRSPWGDPFRPRDGRVPGETLPARRPCPTRGRAVHGREGRPHGFGTGPRGVPRRADGGAADRTASGGIPRGAV